MNNKFIKSFIHVYTGDGKGKTTASMGVVARALGANKKVLIAQFCKGGKRSLYNEYNLFKHNKLIKYRNSAIPHILVTKDSLTDEVRLETKKLWWYVIHNIKEYNVIILDELNIAIDLGIIDIDSVIYLLDNTYDKEIIITGRRANPNIISRADLVTNMVCIKHYYKQGREAKEGVDY